jgi:hypothetical protein
MVIGNALFKSPNQQITKSLNGLFLLLLRPGIPQGDCTVEHRGSGFRIDGIDAEIA